MKTCHSSLWIQTVLEFIKVKQLPLSNATISQYFTFCKRFGMFYYTCWKPVCKINCYGQAKESLVVGGTYHVREKLEAYAIRNLHCWQSLTIIRDNNPQAWKERGQHNPHNGRLMTLTFVPARYARVQAKGSMCSPRGDWLCGGTRNQY